MAKITSFGASLLGLRFSTLANGAVVAGAIFVFDLVLPSWSKVAYILLDHILRAYQAHTIMAASRLPWRFRVAALSALLGMCLGYLFLIPRSRVAVLYCGITGYGGSIVAATWAVIQDDGPYSPAHQRRESIIYTTYSYSLTSYALAHPAGVGILAKWCFFTLGLPILCVWGGLYWLQRLTAFANFVYVKVVLKMISFAIKAWDELLFYEAQVTGRFPQYVQTKWSAYQQRRPERSNLPIYQYKPLSAGEIRLLVLRRHPFYPTVVRADLIHRYINSAPEYEAVSYRWGAAEFTEEVLVNGCRFPVTRSALDLLLARRSPWKDRTIWIDQICINQEDLREKNEQVQLMRDIYHRASRVVAYLGGNWRYRLAGPLIYELFGLTYQTNTDNIGAGSFGAESKSARWLAMAEMFSSEYFNRAWVTQEIAVSRRAELYVGRTYIPWRIFSHVLLWCHVPKRRSLLALYDKEGRRLWLSGRSFENIEVMTRLYLESQDALAARSRAQKKGAKSDISSINQNGSSYVPVLGFEKILYLTFRFSATDARDKVFALVGMARREEDNEEALTRPDYNLPVKEVYRNAAKAIFSLPPERESVHMLAWAGIGFVVRDGRPPPPLPSWVPDFSEDRTWSPYTNPVPSPDLGPFTIFSASGNSVQSIRLDAEDANALFVKVVPIDSIRELIASGPLDWGLRDYDVADVLENARMIHDFVRGAMDLLRREIQSHQGHVSERTFTKEEDEQDGQIHERLYPCLVAGRINRQDAHLARYRGAYESWLRAMDDMVSSCSSKAGGPERLVVGHEEEKAPRKNDEKMRTDIQASIMEACLGRRVAITEMGRRLCLVPPLARPGDELVVPLGAQTPFVVRRSRSGEDDSGKGGAYVLVGETWVEGAMRGELMGSAEPEIIRLS
ncbi:HET-domain-containing protein [Xylariaceae sp. FL0594]|nr:HET-domain-containing protein [Xylariaceae sp. FL0594]